MRIVGEIRKILSQLGLVLETITQRRIASDSRGNRGVSLSSELVPLKGKTFLITGASRGIGLAIAKVLARQACNIVIAAKTTKAHPKLPGTIYTAAKEIEALGGKALPLRTDIRDEEQVAASVEKAVAKFGGIDGVINNASAIHLATTEETPIKRFDLMFDINVRGSFVVTKAALPYLQRAPNPHILTLSPPLDLDPKWFSNHGSYTTSKYAMTLLAMSFAHEYAAHGIASTTLWPRTLIATAAVGNMTGGNFLMRRARKPEIVADAAHQILQRKASSFSADNFIDDELLGAAGISDLRRYAVDPSKDLIVDYFLRV